MPVSPYEATTPYPISSYEYYHPISSTQTTPWWTKAIRDGYWAELMLTFIQVAVPTVACSGAFTAFPVVGPAFCITAFGITVAAEFTKSQIDNYRRENGSLLPLPAIQRGQPAQYPPSFGSGSPRGGNPGDQNGSNNGLPPPMPPYPCSNQEYGTWDGSNWICTPIEEDELNH
jgi:hypothetical protein